MAKAKKYWFGSIALLLILICVCFVISRSKKQIESSEKSQSHQKTSVIESPATATDGSIIVNGKHYANKYGKELFSAILIGKKDDGAIKLMWILRGWPENMSGVVVKRKYDGQWQFLTNEKAVILPEIRLDRDWHSMGMTLQQSEIYGKKLKEAVDLGKVKLVSAQEFTSFLKEKGVRGGDRIAITNNNDLAFFMGFGAIDNAPKQNAEYGVFSVNFNGDIEKSPFATWKNEPFSMEPLALSKIQPFVQQNKIGFTWSIPLVLNDQYGVIGFDVFYYQDNAWKLLGRTYGIAKENLLDFSFIDKQTDAVGKHRYAIAAVNYFNDLTPLKEFEFDEKIFGDITPPELTDIEIEENNIIVNGQIAESDLPKILTVSLERNSNQNDEFKSIGELPQLNARFRLTDIGKKDFGDYYFYRWAICLKNGKTIFSNRKGVASPVRPPQIATPANFEVQRVRNGNNYELKFTWDKVPGARSYRFYQKSDIHTELAQLLAVTDTTYTMEYPAQYSTQTWSFGIAAEPEDEQNFSSSKLAMLKDYRMVSANPVPVKNIESDVNLDTVFLQWDNTERSVTSFEILLNGESKLTLPPTARNATISHVTKTQNGDGVDGMMNITIVSRNELGKADTGTAFFYKIPDPRVADIPLIKNFQAKQTVNSNKRTIELSWQKLSKDNDHVDGIKLRYKIPELNKGDTVLEKTFKTDIPDHYIFEIPENVQKGMRIIFKIEATRILPVKNALPALPGAWTSLILTVE